MNAWPILDGHCDVLYKLLKKPDLDVETDASLDANLSKLRQGGVALQCFAIYLSESMRKEFRLLLKSIDLFRTKLIEAGGLAFVRKRADLAECFPEGDKSGEARLGAMLTLEGVDGLEGDPGYLRTLFELGVRVIGVTWNYANWAADGVLEPRGGGFTLKGREFVKECDRLGMIVDVSHLSERGFWELCELSDRAFLATHANAYAVCAHPRNLRDDQIQAIIARDGRIGLAFVPQFVSAGSSARISQLLLHIDHICSMGGAQHIGFGSDFDGIERYMEDLRSPLDYPRLVEVLLRYYKEEEVQGFVGGNLARYYRKRLPMA